ncbi:MAG: alkaline phosphatase family protein [Anaerolinea sp.]|nr:alkaline phosphatase family protein [Anaerolinea sp.]
MTRSLVTQLLPGLKAHRLSGLDLGADVVYPAYAGASLANLPASLCHWLGVPTFGTAPLAEPWLSAVGGPFRHVLLLLVDGLGLDFFLQRAAQDSWAEILDGPGMVAPLTSVVPSTTSAALTTLWTGQPPATHGVVGYEVWLKEYGMIANLITHAAASSPGDVGGLRRTGFDPLTFLPVPTLAPHLVQHDVHCVACQHHSIAHSGLSTMLQSGCELLPFRNLSDLWVNVLQHLAEAAQQPSYTWMYWGDLDELSHRYGPTDERVELEYQAFARSLAQFVRRLRKRGRGDTLFLITADHGHLHTPKQAQYDLKNHPQMMDCLVMVPSSEARLPFLFVRPGYEERLQRYIAETWPGQFQLRRGTDLLAAGLFGEGEIYARVRDRIGDWVAVPSGNAYWWWANRENPLQGRHGGVSEIEMLTPLIGLVI